MVKVSEQTAFGTWPVPTSYQVTPELYQCLERTMAACTEYSAPLATDWQLMEAGNVVVSNIPDGIPRSLMTTIGLMLWCLEKMVTAVGVIFMVLHRRQNGYGLVVIPTLIVD